MISLHTGISKLYNSAGELDKSASLHVINALTVMQVSTPGAITMAEKEARIQAANILAAEPLPTVQGLTYK